MQYLAVTLALAALAQAFPSIHARHGHSHHRREAAPEAAPDADYDLSKVDWSKVDWASVFGTKPAAATPAAKAQVAAAPASNLVAAAAPAVVVSAAKVLAAAPVAATTTSAAAAAASTPVTKTPSGGKRGLAWDPSNDASLASLFETGALSWVYNWGMGQSFASSMQYVWETRTAAELGALGSVTPGATVLGFNEPDQEGMSAGEAIAHYKDSLTPLRKSGKIGYLISPGITNGGGGLPWLQAFMAGCQDCAIDALAVHWYGPDIGMLKSQIGAIHAAFPSLPIWVTEVGCTNWNPATNPSPAQVAAFMTDAISFFESTSYIAKYSFFGSSYITDPALGTANSQTTGKTAGSGLTALGKTYVS